MLAVLSYTQQKGENKCDKQANVHKFPDMNNLWGDPLCTWLATVTVVAI